MANVDIGRQIKDIALQFAECLKGHIQLHSLYLYGSYAKGTFQADSDIDLAVVADGLTGDRMEDTLLLMKLRRRVDSRIEPYPFLINEFTEHNPMAKEVIRTGIRIV